MFELKKITAEPSHAGGRGLNITPEMLVSQNGCNNLTHFIDGDEKNLLNGACRVLNEYYRADRFDKQLMGPKIELVENELETLFKTLKQRGKELTANTKLATKERLGWIEGAKPIVAAIEATIAQFKEQAAELEAFTRTKSFAAGEGQTYVTSRLSPAEVMGIGYKDLLNMAKDYRSRS